MNQKHSYGSLLRRGDVRPLLRPASSSASSSASEGHGFREDVPGVYLCVLHWEIQKSGRKLTAVAN